MARSRRHFLKLASGAVLLPARPLNAFSDDLYPSRPVHIVVGYTAGGVSDILARLIGQKLAERLGQPFVIDNRPGAASNVGADFTVHAPADGYTLFLAGISNAINVSLYRDLDFNFARDMAPIAIFSRSPLVLEVSQAFPAKTVPEFIAYAKAHPNAISMGSAGTGGATHVAGELFQMMTGTKFVHVPYRGSPPALSDLLGGRIEVMFDNIAASIGLIHEGKLRPLAVSFATEALPHLPLINDFLPGYDAYVWNGLTAPKGTPPEIIAKLNTAVNAIAIEPAFQAQLAVLGSTAIAETPQQFGELIAADTAKWTTVVSFAGIKPE
jgi:tripartite-type tricarboxylate transporter receptor subunit TctC